MDIILLKETTLGGMVGVNSCIYINWEIISLIIQNGKF